MPSDSDVVGNGTHFSAEPEFLADAVPASGDSKCLERGTGPSRLKVYEVGKLTVVGFGGEDVPSEYCISESRHILANLIREHGCEEMIFDLTGVRQIPSGMLGVLASMRNLGVTLSVCNPSADVREVLETTHLDRIIQIRDLEV